MTSIALFCDTASAACSPPSCPALPVSTCPDCPCPRLQSTGQFVWNFVADARSLRAEYGYDWLFLIATAVSLRVLTYLTYGRKKK